MKVNILGTEYSVEIDDTLEKTNADGMCRVYDKEIFIRSVDSMLCDEDSTGTKKMRFNEVLRHEIVHAFFNEAGLQEYSADEQLVDWIAIQFPKIRKAFEECNCM